MSREIIKKQTFPRTWKRILGSWLETSHKCVTYLISILPLRKAHTDSLSRPGSQSCSIPGWDFLHPWSCSLWQLMKWPPSETEITSFLLGGLLIGATLSLPAFLPNYSTLAYTRNIGAIITRPCEILLRKPLEDTEKKNRKSPRDWYKSQGFNFLTFQSFKPTSALEFTSESKWMIAGPGALL